METVIVQSSSHFGTHLLEHSCHSVQTVGFRPPTRPCSKDVPATDSAAGTVAIAPIVGPWGHLLLQTLSLLASQTAGVIPGGSCSEPIKQPHGHLSGQPGWAPGICEASPAGYWASLTRTVFGRRPACRKSWAVGF